MILKQIAKTIQNANPLAFLCATQVLLGAAPAGPNPQIPDGGAAPGAFPNTSVTAVNVVAKGSTTFNSSVEVSGLAGQGPIPWSINRYNRGDFALRLSPKDPVAALSSLGQGFIEYADTAVTVAASQAWRPSTAFGVIIPTARQNGPIDWKDGEGAFYPTVALAESSSAPGYNMADGSYGNGNLDINTGRAGTHASSPEANFSFSATWFPFDQGWLGGEVGSPDATGGSRWTSANAHAAGLAAGMVKWQPFPDGTTTYGGLARLVLPGVNTLEDGMLFATSSDGASDANIIGVAPTDDGKAWLITIREDSATDAETLATGDQSEFQFVYIPFNANRLIGGYVNGSNGSNKKSAGDFSLIRTATGVYELTILGKTGTNGTLILQVADLESNTSVPLASRAFLSYEFLNGKFVIQSRKTVSDTEASLVDASFYFAWIDFTSPLALPESPRMRNEATVAVTTAGVTMAEAGVAANTDAPEVLIVSIDSSNSGAFADPISGQLAQTALIGRFYHARTLAPTSEPFIILGNPSGTMSRNDVKYNPVSKQYVVVSNARAASVNGYDIIMVALVNPAAVAGANSPVAKAFVHDPDTYLSYDDVAVAVSTKNGNFLIVTEHKFDNEGEGTIGALYNKSGTLLTPVMTRVDPLQGPGDEDDPDVMYMADRDAFLYISNTDNSNGSTGTLSNRIVGSVIDTAPDASGKLVVRVEQPMADGLPAGTAEGHPSAIVNPFNSQIIVAYDAGNGTTSGSLSYVNIGPAPNYTFTLDGTEASYLEGPTGDPFKHQHPQMAVDPAKGVIVVGFNAVESSVGLPSAYAFRLLGRDGKPLAMQLDVPYFLADSPGGLSTSVCYHNIVYSTPAGNFVAVFNSSSGVTYAATLEITSGTPSVETAPTLSVSQSGGKLVISWPEANSGFTLQATDSMSSAQWKPAGLASNLENGNYKVTVTPTAGTKFFRLAK